MTPAEGSRVLCVLSKIEGMDAALTDANVEAHDFRLEFAKETLQSFQKRDRSRSPLRLDALSSRARAALDVVCKHDTDQRVDDQRATIVRLQQELAAKDAEIVSLRAGNGPIGPILVSNLLVDPSDKSRASLMAMTETVADFIKRVRWLASCVHDELFWGKHFDGMARNSPSDPR